MGILATPPKLSPQEIRPYQGFINHWFPLIRPAIYPLFLGGGSFGGGAPLGFPWSQGEGLKKFWGGDEAGKLILPIAYGIVNHVSFFCSYIPDLHHFMKHMIPTSPNWTWYILGPKWDWFMMDQTELGIS